MYAPLYAGIVIGEPPAMTTDSSAVIVTFSTPFWL
jgi:hypothetical protein